MLCIKVFVETISVEKVIIVKSIVLNSKLYKYILQNKIKLVFILDANKNLSSEVLNESLRLFAGLKSHVFRLNQ